MANFPKMQLTSKGLELLTNVQAGADTLTFTKTALGDGVISVPISTLTALVSSKAELPISEGKNVGKNTYQIGAFFNNTEITTGFWWREIGVFAKGNNGTEILYCYSNAGDAGDYIPVGTDERIEKYIYQSLIIGNATNVTAEINENDSFVLNADKGKPNGVAPLGADGKIPSEYINMDLSELEKNISNVDNALIKHMDNKKNPHGVNAATVGLDKVPNVATNDQTPTYTEATSLVNLTSGEKLGVAFGKIKKAISTLMLHLNNKDNPHGVTPAKIGALPNTGGSIYNKLFPRIDIYTDDNFARLMKNAGINEKGEKFDYGVILSDFGGKSESEGVSLLLSYKNIVENSSPIYALRLTSVMGGVANYYNIFGEHNKPTGTYKGNGSVDQRTISVGGTGNVLCIYGSASGMAIVTPVGCLMGSSAQPGCKFQSKSSGYGAWFVNGILTIKTNDTALNYNSSDYTYYVL